MPSDSYRSSRLETTRLSTPLEGIAGMVLYFVVLYPRGRLRRASEMNLTGAWSYQWVRGESIIKNSKQMTI
jgi:hypothetical protein